MAGRLANNPLDPTGGNAAKAAGATMGLYGAVQAGWHNTAPAARAATPAAPRATASPAVSVASAPNYSSGGGSGSGGYSAPAPSLPAYSSVFAPTYNTTYGGGGGASPVSIGDSLGAPSIQGLNQALNPAAGWQADQGMSPGQQGLGTRTPSMGIDTLRQIVSRTGRVY